MKKKREEDDINIPKSYCLWGSSSNVGVASDKDNSGREKIQRNKSDRKKESGGSQNPVKEPELSEQGTESCRESATKGKPANKKSRTDDKSESISSAGKRKCGKDTESGNIKTDVTKQDKLGDNRKSKTDIRKTVTGTERRKSKKEISIFPKSNTILGSVKLNSKPVETDDFSIFQIELEGKTYEVSSWSVKDGDYIQGLDSHFLVHGFINKNRDKYLKDNSL